MQVTREVYEKRIRVTENNKDNFWYKGYFDLLQETGIFKVQARVAPYKLRNKFGVFTLNKQGTNTILINTPHGDVSVRMSEAVENAAIGEEVTLTLPFIFADNYFVMQGYLFGMIGDQVRIAMLEDQKVTVSVNGTGITDIFKTGFVPSGQSNIQHNNAGADYVKFPCPYINGYKMDTNTYGPSYYVGEVLNGNALRTKMDWKEIAYPFIFRLRLMTDFYFGTAITESWMTESDKYFLKTEPFKKTFPFVIFPDLYYCVKIDDEDINYLYDTTYIGDVEFYIFNDNKSVFDQTQTHLMLGFRL